MPSATQQKGQAGEKIAAAWLRKRGIRMMASNYRYKHTEIDLIGLAGQPGLERGATIVFIEVKWRRKVEFVAPESAITPAKQKNVIKAARAFLRHHRISGVNCRFDAIVLEGEGRSLKIRHIEDAFIA